MDSVPGVGLRIASRVKVLLNIHLFQRDDFTTSYDQVLDRYFSGDLLTGRRQQ